MAGAIPVKVIGVDVENRRLSLSVKQLAENPWVSVAESMPAGTRTTGKIKGVMSYGLFVEIAPGVEGLLHVSDLSWTEKIEDPSAHYAAGDEIEVKVLEIDAELVRIAEEHLGLQRGPGLQVVTGDARTALDDIDDASVDLVVGDAFGGLSVPWHLTTREVIGEIARVLRDLQEGEPIEGQTSFRQKDGRRQGIAPRQAAQFLQHRCQAGYLPGHGDGGAAAQVPRFLHRRPAEEIRIGRPLLHRIVRRVQG